MNDFYWAFLNNREYLYWKGFCRKDRNIAIYEIEKVANTHGFITDFHMFSDMEICIKIEIEEQNIYHLYTDLKNHITLNDYEDVNSRSKKERSILLNITFLKSTGNLKIEVPIVPG
jgi:hypothetical protein